MKKAASNPTTAAIKAERERDKALAMQEYEADRLAQQANMARLRALRMAKERAEKQKSAARRPVKQRAPTQEPAPPSGRRRQSS